MPLVNPRRYYPAFTQKRDSEQRAVAVGFIPGNGFPAFVTLPLVIGAGANAAAETINGVGFNSGMLMASCTLNNLLVELLHVDPITGATMTPTRSLATLTAGGGVQLINFGVGSTGITTGTGDVFLHFLIRFRNATAGNASLDMFAGIWFQAR